MSGTLRAATDARFVPPSADLQDRIPTEFRYWQHVRNNLPNSWPWALHPVAQFPAVMTLETLRRLLPGLDQAAARVQRWRRSHWYANETGGREAEFRPVEEFRR